MQVIFVTPVFVLSFIVMVEPLCQSYTVYGLFINTNCLNNDDNYYDGDWANLFFK